MFTTMKLCLSFGGMLAVLLCRCQRSLDGHYADVIYDRGQRRRIPFQHPCHHLTRLPVSSQHAGYSRPWAASYKHGVSRVYASPRPFGPAGGNTRDDIIAPCSHWPRVAVHLPNRLPVKWRQQRLGPFTFTVVGGAERLLTSERVPYCSVIGWKPWKRASVAERKERGRAVCKGHRCVGCTTQEIFNYSRDFESIAHV